MTRLSPERQAELYAATLELLTEHGYEGLTMDQVATLARTSKATLYRQWGGKEGLVLEALKSVAPEALDVPDTGSLRKDMHLLVDHADAQPDIETQLVAAVMHACKTSPDLGPAIRERIVENHRVVIDTVLQRAIDRGEVAPDAPGLRFALVLLTGPALLRDLVDSEPADAAYLRDYVDSVFLPALGIPRPS